MLSALMTTRRFAPLFWCQFFSAFNDNFVKNVLVILILYGMGCPESGSLVTLAGAVFIAPYFVLSGLGGQMADRFDKAFVAQRLKLVEISIAVVAAAGFLLHSVPVLFLGLFGFGVIGALFGPIKYGILPDHLARSELPAGNALIEGATFLAILIGTIGGGLVTSWFWLVGAVSLSLMPSLIKTIGGSEEVVTACLAIFSVAIAVGSLLASWLASGRIILVPTPVAALLMGGFALDLGFANWGTAPGSGIGAAAFFTGRGLRIAVDLAGLAMAGGLFIVPVFAAVQAWAGAERRARVVAAVNVLNAAFMTGGALATAALQKAGLSIPALFAILGGLNLAVGALIFT